MLERGLIFPFVMGKRYSKIVCPGSFDFDECRPWYWNEVSVGDSRKSRVGDLRRGLL